jgi:hypothetical protein
VLPPFIPASTSSNQLLAVGSAFSPHTGRKDLIFSKPTVYALCSVGSHPHQYQVVGYWFYPRYGGGKPPALPYTSELIRIPPISARTNRTIRPKASLLLLSLRGDVSTPIQPITGWHSLFAPCFTLQRVVGSLPPPYSRLDQSRRLCRAYPVVSAEHTNWLGWLTILRKEYVSMFIRSENV